MRFSTIILFVCVLFVANFGRNDAKRQHKNENVKINEQSVESEICDVDQCVVSVFAYLK